MERVVRERMTTQDVEAITPQTLINIRPVVASIKEFFGTSQLSQFMDQNNPLAGLTHKRRLSALGPGGISVTAPRWRSATSTRRTTAGCARSRRLRARTSASSARSRPTVGSTRSASSRRSYRVVDGVVTDDIDYLSADEEDKYVVAQANAPIDLEGNFAEERVLVRTKGGEVELIPGDDVDYMDVSPRQMVSAATAMILFLEHDDANRALMGANMQRQAVPLVKSEAPLVGTGMEFRAALDSVTSSAPRRPAS